MSRIFNDFDWNKFWNEAEYTYKNRTGPPITAEDIQKVSDQLGYRLPLSYLELLENKNGGYPINNCFPTLTPTSWADDHVKITSILGINQHAFSILGTTGTQAMMDEWGYPNIGILICDTPSGGHDAIMLDYRKCGNNGEPAVVHIEITDDEPVITHLADNFEAFIRGLVDDKQFEID